MFQQFTRARGATAGLRNYMSRTKPRVRREKSRAIPRARQETDCAGC